VAYGVAAHAANAAGSATSTENQWFLGAGEQLGFILRDLDEALECEDAEIDWLWRAAAHTINSAMEIAA
jgi:hypothetical protein